MIDSKIMEITKSILKDFGNTYFSDKGTLKRNKVIEDLDAYTPMLMKALLANQLIHDTYTESIVIDDRSVEIFKLNQFIEMFTYKEYWQDSYTKFENKIGLTAGGKFIDESADVVLDFPFKDTVLKAGMTKEDQKDANEPFLHETIAKAEIDQLLEPKVFVNATKYDQENLDGVSTDNFDNDNLIIKGNNLIALHSLKNRYAASVKSIFIDPPYFFETTKPADTYTYNSNFKLSGWLTFVQNRIKIAHELLAENGTLFLTMSDEGAHYIKILMDSIFNAQNFIADVTWESRKSISSDALISINTNHVLVYAKNSSQIRKNDFRLALDIDTFKNDDDDGRGKYRLEPFDAPNLRANLQYEIITPSGRHVVPANGRHWRTDKSTYAKLLSENKIYFGKDGNAKPSLKAYYSEVAEAGKGKTASTIWRDNNSIIWDDSGTNTQATKHQVELFSENVFTNPKPEQLIKRILELSTNENDLVLDFFMGSATTQAVAMKMNRRFIGIEQMDYIKTVSVERLKKVIAGEQGGISKDVNWQGGGSFVYAELMEKNQGYLKDVQHAETTKQLEDVVHRMVEGGADFDFRVDVEKVLQDPEYQAMALADKKQLMVKVIDKNQLYYAYSEMEDRDVQDLMSGSDIAFNKSFYGERDL